MSTAKFTLEIMVTEFCSDDNSILKGTLRSKGSPCQKNHVYLGTAQIAI